MQCPECAQAMKREEPEAGISVWSCAAEHGRWVASWVFSNWLARQEDGRLIADCKAVVFNDGSCPECGAGLETSNAGRALAYQIGHCRRCNGVWLDAGQLAELRGKKLSTELDAIFGTIQRRAVDRMMATRNPNQQLPDSGADDPSQNFNTITKRKPFFSVSEELMAYLKRYGRSCELPAIYDELADFDEVFPCMDPDGNDTLWQTVSYEPERQAELGGRLGRIYSELKTGDPALIEHFRIERIDYCDFGNSKPFRIRVVNEFNDNYDHFYVKVPDASRVYGLELEHILSPNLTNYLVHENTLIEEHIAGIPGDVFIRDHISKRRFNQVRVAKEFVKFNERCFIRLLGDMRSYNYVVDMTPDFEETQFRVRAIDFDQQSYEGGFRIYLPQFYKENAAVRDLCMALLNYPTIRQYQLEERTMVARRIAAERTRLDALFACMRADEISSPEKIAELVEGLNEYHETNVFSGLGTMGEVVERNIEVAISKAKGKS